MEFIVKILKKLGIFEEVREVYLKRKLKKRKKRNLRGKYKFEDRRKGNKKMCMILAGYKMFCADVIFDRIKKFVPKDVDVCILSSGKYSEELSELAKKNNWSYLSTKRNNVSLIQNIAIKLHKDAKYIYKLDEDVFVTKNYFKTLFDTMKKLEKDCDYEIGYIAPTIPINGYGNLNVLKKYNLVEYYTKTFERPVYSTDFKKAVIANKDAAKFFWGKGNYLPNIDVMDNDFNKDPFKYEACPVRFSIGAILFKRDFFEEMGMFDVPRFGSAMGMDEVQICRYCLDQSKGMLISLNTVVGHLSFGSQNKSMEEYFLKHKDVFEIHKINGGKSK